RRLALALRIAILDARDAGQVDIVVAQVRPAIDVLQVARRAGLRDPEARRAIDSQVLRLDRPADHRSRARSRLPCRPLVQQRRKRLELWRAQRAPEARHASARASVTNDAGDLVG